MNKKGALGYVFALLFIASLNLMFFMFQTAINETNPVNPTQFYTHSGSLMASYDAGNYTLNESIDGQLPTASGSVTVETGNIFTDTWATIKSFFMESRLMRVVNALPIFLKAIGFPAPLVFAIGFVWHALTIVFIIMFWRGN